MWSDWFVVAFLIVALAAIGLASFVVRRLARHLLGGRSDDTATTGRILR